MVYEIDDYPNPHPNGMGVAFNFIVWQMLRLREMTTHVNITKPTNPYRETARGQNVWDYYFLQEKHPGAIHWPAPVEDPLDLPFAGNRDWTLGRQHAIQRFASSRIHLRPELQEEVDAFCREHFKGRVLGVHLRGTDKIEEYRPMKNADIVHQINLLVERLRPDTIFLQTDDIEYWKLMQRFKPVSINIPRSKKCLHHGIPRGPYESGKWAVIDGMLGARCDWYAYTPSNFATISIIMGRHQELHRINRHCVIDPFCTRVDTRLGLL